MNETFINISKIIERDSKSTTYKFALLRGTIDIIQENSPYIEIKKNVVEIPMGLLIEKWMLYYYPILGSTVLIPQINGVNSKLAFHTKFLKIINYYNEVGGLSTFYNDIRIKGISKELNKEFYDLVKDLKNIIVKNPMQYIGNSFNKSYYSIYQYQNNSTLKNSETQNTNWLINSCGIFTIPIEYYNAFKLLGSFISGTDNILFKWADFSVNASHEKINPEKVIAEILKNPITDRDVLASKNLYKSILNEAGEIICVWSETKIKTCDVDHVIPFSIMKNNDLWNLLPAKSSINNNKRDKIPSVDFIIKQKDIIIHYWEIIHKAQEKRFLEEIQITLLGNNKTLNWQNLAFNQLTNMSKYLIEKRGYEKWEL
ncbi:HNH endonuclease domain-containing protein [Flavobacterium sp.]|uniref:HNH endonuclease domain-containing protein n=1 Tax=Flavobacterium sp. TaxID=239 RepID=UPI0026075C4D|nr:HNH endonuclease domain-containing protein [Flavobacterium sp.]